MCQTVLKFSQELFSQVESKFGYEAFPSLTEESIKRLKQFGAHYDSLLNDRSRKTLLEKTGISKDERDDIETYFKQFPKFKVEITQAGVDENM